MARHEHSRARLHTDTSSSWPQKHVSEQKTTLELTPSQQFERRHQIPGVAETLQVFPWADTILVNYFRHFPEGALDSLRVASLCYAYAQEKEYDSARTMSLTAAALTHDGGKPKVAKADLESDQVYSPEERLQKLSRHVEEGVRLIIGQDDTKEIDYTGVNKERVRIALISGGHHLDQDDRGSYPSADVSWLQTGDLTIIEDRKALQVADRVEAQRSARSYKRAFSEEETRANLKLQGIEGEIVDFMLAQYEKQTAKQDRS